MASKVIRKFTFNDFFDLEAKAPEPVVEEPAAPVFSETELADARDEGFRAGAAAALEQSDQSDQRRVALAAEHIAERLDALIAGEAARTETLRVGAINVAMAALGKFAPDLLRRIAKTEITQLIDEIIAERPEEPRLVARVSDHTLDELSAMIDGFVRDRGFGGKLALIADPALGVADVRIEWADGGVERVADRTFADIRQMLTRLSALAMNPAGDPASLAPDSGTRRHAQ